MRTVWLVALVGAMSSGLLSSRATAQSPGDDSARSGDTVDSTEYVKAFDLVSNGEPEDGKALVDSLLHAAKEGTPEYAEGLYWRARLASMGPSAERDYRRIIVDYPYNRRAADALLRLGQLELGRGDRDIAAQHFQRVVMDYPHSAVYAAGNYWLARAYFAGNKLERACIANAEALAKVSPSDIELKNQIDFQNQQCRDVSLTPPDADSAAAAKGVKATKNVKGAKTPAKKVAVKGAVAKTATKTVASAKGAKAKPAVDADSEAVDSTSMEPSENKDRASTDAMGDDHEVAPDDSAMHDGSVAAADTVRDDEGEPPPKPVKTAKGKKVVPVKSTKPAAKPAASSKIVYMVQVAAYQTRGQAEALVTSLKKQGYTSHIDGKVAPYRVRMGHFATRQEAVTLLAKLKAKQIDGFVTEG